MRNHKINLSSRISATRFMRFSFSLYLIIFITASCAFGPLFSDEDESVNTSTESETAKVNPSQSQNSVNHSATNPAGTHDTAAKTTMSMGSAERNTNSQDSGIIQSSPENQSEESHNGGFISKITKTLTFQDKNSADQENLQKARMVARLNDLEAKVNEQSQKIRVLEKAVKLGIIPEEMKTDKTHSNQLLADYAGEDSTLDSQSKNDLKRPESRKGELKKDMSEANALFTKGEYGKAFVAFQKIDQKYSESDKQGESLYWMGRCWFALKEYQTAKQYFKDMIRSNPASTRVGQAKVLIAQSEMKLGLNEEALATLRDIIREHPEGNASEEARKILSQLKDSL